mgnify:CR=1 FL=1
MIINLVIAIIAQISAMVYLRVATLTKRHSIYEIAYLLIGRKSIFIVCSGLLLTGLASMILYYIIIGDTVAQLWAQFFVKGAAGRKFSDVKVEL